MVETPKDGLKSYVWIYEEVHWFVFSVHACHQASVVLAATALHEDNNATNNYEVIFGSQDSSDGVIIKKNPGGNIVATSSKSDVLNCYIKRWVLRNCY